LTGTRRLTTTGRQSSSRMQRMHTSMLSRDDLDTASRCGQQLLTSSGHLLVADYRGHRSIATATYRVLCIHRYCCGAPAAARVISTMSVFTIFLSSAGLHTITPPRCLWSTSDGSVNVDSSHSQEGWSGHWVRMRAAGSPGEWEPAWNDVSIISRADVHAQSVQVHNLC
jgi:hypothetical protein